MLNYSILMLLESQSTVLEYGEAPIVVDSVAEAWDPVAVHSFPTSSPFQLVICTTISNLSNPQR
jgi:hypothetical protein